MHSNLYFNYSPDSLDTEAGPSDDGRRAIGYDIAKNKGLTIKRKKELQNPRVKHRVRFNKALKKRKSQVREPRKELVKYDGERTGIKANVVRSVKFVS